MANHEAGPVQLPEVPSGPARPLWYRAWRVVRRMTLSLLFIGGCLAIFLLLYQGRMIYFPRPYESHDRVATDERLSEIDFKTAQGTQRAFYMASRDGSTPPTALWVVFSGNATCALDWRFFAEDYPDDGAGFLLLDYPGYGDSKGTPSPRSILDASNGALSALAAHLSTDVPTLESRLHTLGHSLGAAASLQFAVQHPVRRVVIVSPFTSLKDMAGRVVGWPLKHVLIHNFDNRKRLDELAARPEPPSVVVIHGAIDEIIPVQMGRELGSRHPSITKYVEIPGGDHNGILGIHEKSIWREMMGE